MKPIIAVLLLIASFCHVVIALSKQCSGSDTCVNINQCAKFGPHYFEPARWSQSLKQEFQKRVCLVEKRNGKNAYKVCCPRSLPTRSDNVKRGVDVLDLEGCGAYSEDRIAFGKDAKLFQFPWMVLLKRRDGDFACGGTLINERYVLTAAHCLRENIISVRLGEFDLSKPIDCDKRGELCAPPPQDIAVERSILHDAYSQRYKLNDIGLIRLAKPASYNDNVLPICLPVGPAMRTTQTTFFVAGWGTTENDRPSEKLKFTKLNLVAIDDCQQQLANLNPPPKLNNDQMCATGPNLTDNCTGDSGGPLKSISVNARYVQYGVVSFGLSTCGKESAPGVYTKVESYIDWILDNLEE